MNAPVATTRTKRALEVMVQVVGVDLGVEPPVKVVSNVVTVAIADWEEFAAGLVENFELAEDATP